MALQASIDDYVKRKGEKNEDVWAFLSLCIDYTNKKISERVKSNNRESRMNQSY